MFGLVPFKTNAIKGSDDSTVNFVNGFFDDNYIGHYNTGSKFKADIKETSDQYELEAELPGVKKEDIYLEYNDGYLIIEGRREDVSQKNNYVRKERHCGEFSRNFKIDNVKQEEISAQFENGVLQVILPKRKIRDNSKRISIN